MTVRLYNFSSATPRPLAAGGAVALLALALLGFAAPPPAAAGDRAALRSVSPRLAPRQLALEARPSLTVQPRKSLFAGARFSAPEPGLSASGEPRLGTPPPGYVFDVNVHTPALAAEIPSAPGSYPVAPVLRLTVTASMPGWRILAQATDLKPVPNLAGEKIGEREVFYVPAGGEPIAVAQMAPIVQEGGRGQTLVELPLVLVTDAPHAAGVYQGEVRLVFQEANGPQSPALKIPLRVTVASLFDLQVAGSLDFGSVQSGTHWPAAPATVTVTTNQPGRAIQFTLEGLENGDGTALIPAGRLALGFGPTPDAARADAAGKALGQTTILWTLPGPGEHKVYLDCRLELTDASTPPGSYHGLVTVVDGSGGD